MSDKKNILIIDDEDMVRDFIVEILESQGYQTLTASDGKSGIETAKKFKPDLILMDVNMPVMDGFEALRIIKNDFLIKRIPVILLTNRQSAEDVQKGISLLAEKYLPKPFTREGLLREIGQSLGRQ